MTVSTIDTRLRDGAYDGDHFFDAAVAARAAARAHGTSAVRVALLRGGRDVKTWLADLRAEEQATYRAASLSEDDLFALLEDPKASDELRAAAAARLAKLDAPRLRIASEGVAAPKVRVAVDAALANDEEALAKALDEISFTHLIPAHGTVLKHEAKEGLQKAIAHRFPV